MAVLGLVAYFFLRTPAVETIALSQSTIELEVDETATASYIILPEKASSAEVLWASSDESVATVSSTGEITGLGKGSCTITVYAGEKSDELEVIVKYAVEKIELSKTFITVDVDKSQTVSYTITPNEASDAEVTWTSSNESVATVSPTGTIVGKRAGSCTITVTAGEHTDTVGVQVQDGPNFREIYLDLGSPTLYCEIASDGSYLSLDTNPFDYDDYFLSTAYYDIERVIKALGLPESLFVEMGQTRALDGRMSQEFDNVVVSWSYHPDDGLEVMFKKKN